jgi:hypothetical protein
VGRLTVVGLEVGGDGSLLGWGWGAVGAAFEGRFLVNSGAYVSHWVECC